MDARTTTPPDTVIRKASPRLFQKLRLTRPPHARLSAISTGIRIPDEPPDDEDEREDLQAPGHPGEAPHGLEERLLPERDQFVQEDDQGLSRSAPAPTLRSGHENEEEREQAEKEVERNGVRQHGDVPRQEGADGVGQASSDAARAVDGSLRFARSYRRILPDQPLGSLA